MHPCISQFREHFQEALNESTFMKTLRNVEHSTGLSLSVLTISFSVFVVIYIFVECWYELVCDAITILFPAHFSLLSMNHSNELQKKWLTYWMIFSIITIAEFHIRRCFILHPCYWVGKCAFLLWCCLPIEHNGSELFYNQIVCRLYQKPIKSAEAASAQRKDSQESKLSFSEEIDRNENEDISSEKETMENLLNEKKAKDGKESSRRTSCFFRTSFRQKTKKKEGAEDEESVKDDSSVSGKSGISSIFKSGKSLFSKNRKNSEASVEKLNDNKSVTSRNLPKEDFDSKNGILEEAPKEKLGEMHTSVSKPLDDVQKVESINSDALSDKGRLSKSATSSVFGSGKSLFSKKKKAEKETNEQSDAINSNADKNVLKEKETDITSAKDEPEKSEVTATEIADETEKTEVDSAESADEMKEAEITAVDDVQKEDLVQHVEIDQNASNEETEASISHENEASKEVPEHEADET